eukprot:2513777-Lingulodinium_polyedra.AAC.1
MTAGPARSWPPTPANNNANCVPRSGWRRGNAGLPARGTDTRADGASSRTLGSAKTHAGSMAA